MFDRAAAAHMTCGRLLEVGPGTVWPGFRLLARWPQLDLVGAGYTEEERQQAKRQAAQLGFSSRVQYPAGGPAPLPLEDNSVDHVFSFGGLQRWTDPLKVCNEIARVLKPGGKFFLGDAARGGNWLSAWLTAWSYPGLKAVYQTRVRAWEPEKLKALLEDSRLPAWKLEAHPPDLWVVGA